METIISNRRYRRIISHILAKCPKYLGYPPNRPKQLPNFCVLSKTKNKWCAEYAYEKRGKSITKIYFLRPNIKSPIHLVKTIIHEYTHYVQMATNRAKKQYEEYNEISYKTNPYEIEAISMEHKYSEKIYALVKHLFK